MNRETMGYIPIDFIKAEIVGLSVSHFSNNNLLKNPQSVFNGEYLTKTIYTHKNLKIRIYENNNRIEFLGSLHTFYNNGIHNHNDFGCLAFLRALDLLFQDLGIKPRNLRIIQLEYGFNLFPYFTSNYVIDGLIQHKSVNKTVGIDCKLEGNYVQFKHSETCFKIYNKGKHFKLLDEVLRIEIKQTNWSKYRLKGIITLEDFINADKMPFFNELLNQWQRVVMYDIDNKKTEKYIKYQTSSFWKNLRENNSNKTFKYHFDKLKKLNRTVGFNVQSEITRLLIQKGNELQL